MIWDAYGEMAKWCNHFSPVILDELVIMTNHVHGIINIVGARHAVPLLSREPIWQPMLTLF